mgnify:CR=1 FL=1
MTAAERTILERFKGLVSERVALYKLVLFGSRARGDADPSLSWTFLLLLMELPTKRPGIGSAIARGRRGSTRGS